MKNLENEIIVSLQMLEIILIAVVSFIFMEITDKQQNELTQVHNALDRTRIELKQCQEELKHNDNIMLKVLNQEW